MRKPEYISPSALAQYDANKEEYYLKYLADVRPPQIPQTPAMAVGSAFDAFIKSYLHDTIFGPGHPEAAKYDCQTLFESQVEKQNRDVCWNIGRYLFDEYKKSGALADLMLEIQNAVDEPRFEFEVKGVIKGYREGVTKSTMGVPLLGKPDIRFINSEGAHCIFDWKVNGFYSKSNTSPMQGYVKCRTQEGQHWTTGLNHKDAVLVKFKGMTINGAGYLEEWNPEWATQLAVYCWLLGEAVGIENVVGIDQIACNGVKRNGQYPNLRVASHRCRISSRFQFEVISRFQELWSILIEEPFHFFRDLKFEESEAKCKMIEERAALYKDPELTSDERWALDLARIPKW